MIWYLVLGYLAACYLWGMYIVARLYTGRRLRTLVTTGASGAVLPRTATPMLRLTDAPMPKPTIQAERPQSEAA
jgi:hypothetical protein